MIQSNYIVVPRLGKILKERNMTQVELSELTGIPQGTISKFDRNKQHQSVHLIAISKALNLKCIDELFDVFEEDPFHKSNIRESLEELTLDEKMQLLNPVKIDDQEKLEEALKKQHEILSPTLKKYKESK